MKEKQFHHHCHEYVNKDVEVITLQGTFEGRVIEVSRDVLIIESRMPGRSGRSLVRIESIVAISPVEIVPRGPFDFYFGNVQQQQQPSEINEPNS